MRIFALGPEGTFGHMAAKQVKTLRPEWLEENFTIDFAPTHTEVLKRAEKENTMGIIAVRNSLSNNVPDSTAYLARMTQDHPLTIIGEMWLDIEQCLLVRKGVADIDQITTIASFPQATDQCTRYLGTLGKQLIPAKSTADAALTASQDASGSTAAIGNALAAELYGLSILERGIQDEQDNRTLFWLFGPRSLALPSNRALIKNIVVCQIPDQIGSLFRLLGELNEANVNIEHLYTYRRGEHLKFIFELRYIGPLPQYRLLDFASSAVELGSFPVEKQ